MISNKLIFDNTNQIISGGNLSKTQITQLFSMSTLIENSFLSVPALTDLPDVVLNLGSLIFVVAENKYYYSNGETWNIDYSSEFIDSQSVALAWGLNSNGQLGNGTTTDRSSPVSVGGGITDWTQVSAGGNHCVGITAQGVALAWGLNYRGQLGDGTTTVRASPVSVVGGITDWTQVSAGYSHTVGITAQGVALAWGLNSQGQLGDGAYGYGANPSPVSVVGGITDWTQVSAGSNHTVGITAQGVALAWGRNSRGQLGNGATSGYSANPSPVSVVGGITDWTQVSAGGNHTVGITAQGVALAWGFNNQGQLGDNTYGGYYSTPTTSPVSVVGGITDWTQVSAGNFHTVGITAQGVALAWGRNTSGQLGNGTTTGRSSPVSVGGGITNWTQVSAGDSHCVGITAQGVALAWGRNLQGQLGDGTTSGYSANPSPVSVVGGITNWTQVSAGSFHTVGIVLIPLKGF